MDDKVKSTYARDVSDQGPLLSVIIAVYNAEPYLAEALDSLLVQGFRDMEILTEAQALTETVIGIDPSLELFEHRGIREQLESFWEKAVTASGLSG